MSPSSSDLDSGKGEEGEGGRGKEEGGAEEEEGGRGENRRKRLMHKYLKCIEGEIEYCYGTE